MVNRFPVLFVACWLAAACRPTPPAPPRLTTETSVATSYGKTWDALVQYVTEQRIPIKSTERASGLLVTDLASLPRPQIGAERSYADCGTTVGIANYPTYVTTTFVVRGDSTNATIQATSRFNRQDGTQCISLGHLEEAWEREIRDRAEGKAKP